MSSNNSNKELTNLSEVDQLLSLALISNLKPSQQVTLKEAFQSKSFNSSQIPVGLDKLPSLVEHNPVIAVELLLHLENRQEFSEYLEALISMEVSLQSMEVVNQLTTSIQLPPSCLHRYIYNCLSQCQKFDEDKLMQNRYVRLVCVFIQSLLRNKLVIIQEIHVEVEGFCQRFNKIREATSLLGLLQHKAFSNETGGDH